MSLRRRLNESGLPDGFKTVIFEHDPSMGNGGLLEYTVFLYEARRTFLRKRLVWDPIRTWDLRRSQYISPEVWAEIVHTAQSAKNVV